LGWQKNKEKITDEKELKIEKLYFKTQRIHLLNKNGADLSTISQNSFHVRIKIPLVAST
jgi:hypothetical protein